MPIYIFVRTNSFTASGHKVVQCNYVKNRQPEHIWEVHIQNEVWQHNNHTLEDKTAYSYGPLWERSAVVLTAWFPHEVSSSTRKAPERLKTWCSTKTHLISIFLWLEQLNQINKCNSTNLTLCNRWSDPHGLFWWKWILALTRYFIRLYTEL